MKLQVTNMPELKDFRQTKKIKLPSIPDGEIEIYDSHLFGNTILDEDKEEDIFFKNICNLIKDWNLTQEEKKIPITIENLKRLPKDAGDFLVEEIAKLVSNKKKE